MNAVSSKAISSQPTSLQKARRSQLLAQQLALFQHLSLILRHLMERVEPADLSPVERRSLQRDLAGLKKAVQGTRHRLKSPLHRP
jgi:hypothetical protein